MFTSPEGEKTCRQCSIPCSTCDVKADNCTSCVEEHYYANNTCKTPEGLDKQCTGYKVIFDETGQVDEVKCAECNSTLHFKLNEADGSCVCMDGYKYGNGECKLCKDLGNGYLYDDSVGDCVFYPDRCSDDTIGFEIEDNSYTILSPSCGGDPLNVSVSQCVPCSYLTCVDHCSSCSSTDGQNYECLTCDNGFVIGHEDDQFVCNECKSNQYWSLSVNETICYDCKPHCNNCSDYESCIECEVGYFWNSTSTSCQSVCMEGTHFWNPGDGESEPLCERCIENCLKCSDRYSCSVCAHGYELDNDGRTCRKICKKGYTWNNLTSSYDCVECNNYDDDGKLD
jgi:hypothetical protein